MSAQQSQQSPQPGQNQKPPAKVPETISDFKEMLGMKPGQRVISNKGRLGTISGLNITQSLVWVNLDAGGFVCTRLSKFPSLTNPSLTHGNFVAPKPNAPAQGAVDKQ